LKSIHESLNKQYYDKSSWILILLPLSFIYLIIITFRSWAYKIGIFKTIRIDVPVVVVGNITIGGTGKTPLIIWLLEKLIKFGMKPGIISRGYNSNVNFPQEVFTDSEVSNVGDEALMMKLRHQRDDLDIPIFVGKKRAQVGKALLKSYPDVNILISDDGLQHYELYRDFEIVVIDETRQFGNEFLIPAGPLREGVTKASKVDALVINSQFLKKNSTDKNGNLAYGMNYYGDLLVNCFNNKISDLGTLENEVVVITGIGNPERFFKQLSTAGLKFKKIVFNDHHLFLESDFKEYVDMDIIMTEKDAVKCKNFAKKNFWYLPIHANVDEGLLKKLMKKLRIIING